MSAASPTTTSEILDEVIQPVEPSFAPEFARMMLTLRLSDSAQDRIRELLQRNNEVLENYLLVGQFLDLLQAKARVSLQNGSSSR